jgi:hypothetical protein
LGRLEWCFPRVRLRKMRAWLSRSPRPARPMPLQSVEQKLKDLKSLLDQGLITQIDYDAKKAQILEKL